MDVGYVVVNDDEEVGVVVIRKKEGDEPFLTVCIKSMKSSER